MVWYSHLFQNFPQFIEVHTVKGFGILNKAEIDILLELSCFFKYPVDAGNLISRSSAFSKSSLNIWKFTVHILLKRGFENFQTYKLGLENAEEPEIKLPTFYRESKGISGKKTNTHTHTHTHKHIYFCFND